MRATPRATPRSNEPSASCVFSGGARALPREPAFEMQLDLGPLAREDTVDDDVARGAVAPRPEVPHDAVFLRAERLDRALRREVELVGAKADDLAAELLEGMREQQQLAARVDVAALPALRVPRVADLDAVDVGDDVVETRAADDRTRRDIAHGPRQHAAFALPRERGLDIGLRFGRRRHGREPELPQRAVGCGSRELAFVLHAERLEPHAVAF